EDDEALQAAEAEFPQRVDGREGAQLAASQQQSPKRDGLVGQQRVRAPIFESQERYERERGGDDREGGDREWKRPPDREEESAREQSDAEAGAAQDRLARLRAGVEAPGQQVGIERAIGRVIEVVADEE